MRAKPFSIALIAACASVVVATAAANLVLDPQLVFRTGFVTQSATPNMRYQRVLDYDRDARKVDGLLFGTSRGQAFDPDEFARLAGLGHVAPFAVPLGTMLDYLPILEYVLHDKAVHGERIRRILLLLDADLFGVTPWSNNLDTLLPPRVSGEPAGRFWSRYLLAVQFNGWRQSLAHTGWLARRQASALPQGVQLAALERENATTGDAPDQLRIRVAEAQSQGPKEETVPVDVQIERAQRNAKAAQPLLEPQLKRLERFIALCRQNDIELTIAINPLHHLNAEGYEAGRLQAVVSRINQLADIWEFDAPAWLSHDNSHWRDLSHFKGEIASMMLQRMFGSAAPPAADFGRFRKMQ